MVVGVAVIVFRLMVLTMTTVMMLRMALGTTATTTKTTITAIGVWSCANVVRACSSEKKC